MHHVKHKYCRYFGSSKNIQFEETVNKRHSMCFINNFKLRKHGTEGTNPSKQKVNRRTVLDNSFQLADFGVKRSREITNATQCSSDR